MINNIVLDSNAFFKSNRLLQLVKDSTPYTTPQVMEELKDQKTKEILESFPFKIEVREPSKESLKFVRNFAVLTGDHATLSDTDIGVIALTYDLIEKIGLKDKLNKQPKPFQSPKSNPENQSISESSDEDNNNKSPQHQLTEQFSKLNTNDKSQQHKAEQVKQISQPQGNAQKDQQVEQQNNKTSEQLIKHTENKVQQSHQEKDAQDDGWIQIKPKKRKVVKTKESGLNDWITPENYNEKKAKGLLNIQERQISSIPQSDIPVWLITGDFSMQNVAMQIGIPTKAADGHQIFSLKRYVQMCYACNKVIKQNIDKIITCTKCGYNTLSKVAYTIDQSGNMILHRKKNWTPNKQVFEWKQKKLQEQAKHSKNQRKKKVKSMFE